MKAEFIEKYDRLFDMSVGDIAVSSDRESIFICAHGTPIEKDKDGKRYSVKVIVDLNSLFEQYLGDHFGTVKIKKLERGDQFVLTV